MAFELNALQIIPELPVSLKLKTLKKFKIKLETKYSSKIKIFKCIFHLVCIF